MKDKENLTPPPVDETKFGYDQPLQMSPEDLEKAGKPTGYVRFVRFENGVIIDASISPSNLVDTISKGMNQDEDLAQAIQAAVAMYKMRKNPIGRMLSQLFSNEDGPCGCPDCVEKREKSAAEKEPADAEKTAG